MIGGHIVGFAVVRVEGDLGTVFAPECKKALWIASMAVQRDFGYAYGALRFIAVEHFERDFSVSSDTRWLRHLLVLHDPSPYMVGVSREVSSGQGEQGEQKLPPVWWEFELVRALILR